MDAVWRTLLSSNRVLLTGPVKPDGDSIGACLALKAALVQHGVSVDIAGDIVDRYAWIPGADAFLSDSEIENAHYETVVILDGDQARLTKGAEKVFNSATQKAIIDHHA